MLGPGIIKDGNDFGPSLSLLLDKPEDLQILGKFPFTLDLGLIEMIEPPFPTLLGCSEHSSFASEEHFLGDFVPLASGVVLDEGTQKLVFFSSPGRSVIFLDQDLALILKEDGLLIEKHL